MGKLTRRQVLSICFGIVCLIGFIVQVIQISNEYLQYKTSSRIHLELDDRHLAPNTALCVNVTTILRRHDELIYRNESDDFLVKGKDGSLDHSTLRDYFDKTPSVNETIEDCEHRGNNNNFIGTTFRQNSTLCHQKFKVYKYFTQRKMCYVFPKISNVSYETSELAQALTFTRKYYQLQLRPVFNDVPWVQVIAFFGEYPYTSKHFARGHSRPDLRSTSVDNRFVVTHQIYDITLLPAPYDTNCSPNSNKASAKCRFHCLLKKLSPFNRIPSSEIIEHPMDGIPVTPEDVDIGVDADRAENISAIHRECNTECKQPKCYFNFTMSQHESSYTHGKNIQLIAVSAQSPTLRVKAVANLSFVEFLVYIGEINEQSAS